MTIMYFLLPCPLRFHVLYVFASLRSNYGLRSQVKSCFITVLLSLYSYALIGIWEEQGKYT